MTTLSIASLTIDRKIQKSQPADKQFVFFKKEMQPELESIYSYLKHS